jgi:hypothetical protein
MKILIIIAGQSYGLIPALTLELLFRPRWNSCSGLAGTPVPASLELLFRLAGIHVFLILDFQEQ